MGVMLGKRHRFGVVIIFKYICFYEIHRDWFDLFRVLRTYWIRSLFYTKCYVSLGIIINTKFKYERVTEEIELIEKEFEKI